MTEWSWKKLADLQTEHACSDVRDSIVKTACRLSGYLDLSKLDIPMEKCAECLAMLTCTENWTDGDSLLQEALFYSSNGYNVAVIAVVNPGIDWAAYVGGCDGRSTERDTAYWVARYGCKLPVEHACHFFPRLSRRLYRRG